MKINLKRAMADVVGEKLVAAALRPKGQGIKPNQLIRALGITGRRDPLTELQQKILTAAISFIRATGESDSTRMAYKIKTSDFLKLCDIGQENIYPCLIKEIEKMSQKGVWLYDEKSKRLTRTQWFQAIEYTDSEIVFQFAARILVLIAAIAPADTEYQLVKGIQYKGKYTLAVFEILWSGKSAGVMEYAIPELMKQLSLEHTRYSYGQLKLRVLEPSLHEIYEWDEEIFVRFGPTFSGRRVEGVWFEVTDGEAARALRKNEPEFRFASPDQKPDKVLQGPSVLFDDK
jgi:plasmid replication initiation protein